MKVFRWLYITTNVQPHKDKFASKASKCVFIRYVTGTEVYKVYKLSKKWYVYIEMLFPMSHIFPTNPIPIQLPHSNESMPIPWFMKNHNLSILSTIWNLQNRHQHHFIPFQFIWFSLITYTITTYASHSNKKSSRAIAKPKWI